MIIDELGKDFSHKNSGPNPAELPLTSPRDGPIIKSTDACTRQDNFRTDVLDKTSKPLIGFKSQFDAKLTEKKENRSGSYQPLLACHSCPFH